MEVVLCLGLVSRAIPSGGSAALVEVSDASVVLCAVRVLPKSLLQLIQHVLMVPHVPNRTADAG